MPTVRYGVPEASVTRWKAPCGWAVTWRRSCSVTTVEVGAVVLEARRVPYSAKTFHGFGLPFLPSSLTMRWSCAWSSGRSRGWLPTRSRRVMTAVSWLCLRTAVRACW